jgi:hypothetical protein
MTAGETARRVTALCSRENAVATVKGRGLCMSRDDAVVPDILKAGRLTT